MDFGAVAESVWKQFVTVWNAPVPFLAALLLMGWVIWKIVSREYETRLANAASRLELADARLADYERKAGASPDEAGAKIAALERQVAKLAESPREVDGIYQHNRLRGEGKGAIINLASSSVEFAAIVADGDFNADAEFEFREWKLRIGSCDVSNRVTMAGHGRVSFVNVMALVLGQRE